MADKGKKKKKIKPGTVIDLPQEFIVLCSPESTLELDIRAKIYMDGDTYKVSTHMDYMEVRDAINDAKRNYIPDDALFMLAPTKEEKLKNLLDRFAQKEDDE